MATPQEQQVGFDCEFTERPQEQFQVDCPICLLVLREPHQVTCCGNSFCRSCIERVLLQRSACPTCNRRDFTVLLNKGLKRSLYAFKVRCSHEKEGCQWTGELGELDKHLNEKPRVHGLFVGCAFADVECCYCSEHFKRHNLITHQIEKCTRQPYTISLIARYIDRRVQNSERYIRDKFKTDQAQLLSANEKLKCKVQTLEQYSQDGIRTLQQYCRDQVQTVEQCYSESLAKLADQQKSMKLLWWGAMCMMVMFVVVTYLAWYSGSQKREVIVYLRQGNNQTENKEIVLKELFEEEFKTTVSVMNQQLNQKLERMNQKLNKYYLEYGRMNQKLDKDSSQAREAFISGLYCGVLVVFATIGGCVYTCMCDQGHQGHRRHRQRQGFFF